MNKAILAQLARRCVMATAVAVGSATLTLAQDKPAAKITLPAGVTQGASVEGISEFQLKNGMKVLLFPDPSKPTITVNVTYLVGSRHEGLGEAGMAHLLEHMVFKGSTKHTNIPQELSSHGADFNGTTWLDRTNYFETFSANDENLKWALDMEADRMVNSFIKKEDLQTEFSVVRNEFEIGENSPQRLICGTTTENQLLATVRILNASRLRISRRFISDSISPITRHWSWPARLTNPRRWR
jgi:zinc protease